MTGSRRPLIVLATLAGSLNHARGFDDPKAKAPHPLVGRRKEVSIEVNGRRLSDSTSTALEFKDGRWTTKDGDGGLIASGTFRVDDSKNPRWLDMKVEKSEPPEVPKQSTEGIYKIDGDSLTISDSLSKGRPGGFVTANNAVFVSVWTRVK